MKITNILMFVNVEKSFLLFFLWEDIEQIVKSIKNSLKKNAKNADFRMGCSSVKILVVQMNTMVHMERGGFVQNIVEECILENILLINEYLVEHLSHHFNPR